MTSGDDQKQTGRDVGRDTVDSALQQEVDAALGTMSLMDMADEPRVTTNGSSADLRRGTVAAIQRDDILVDLGSKSTGILPIKQLGEEPVPEVGDTIEVLVTGYNESEGLLVLSRKDAVLAATWDSVKKGQRVEGRVIGFNAGGLELRVDGLAAFMPFSQVERHRVDEDDIALYVNKRLPCQVIEIRRKDKTLVVSRRALLEREAADARAHLFESLQEDQDVRGTVRSIMPYGAFVDIGGADGLLHVRDLGYARIEDPASVVHVGQELTVRVLKIDRENKKIALGLKQTLADPWTDAVSKWPVDELVSGRITRLTAFGAFVELAEGVEGLVPISEMTFGRRIGHPKEVVQEGEIVQVRVLAVDIERHRISLSIKRVGEDPWMGASIRWTTDSVAEGTVTRLTEFGAFVELASGVEGLVHISELSQGHVHSAGDAVKVGQTVQAKVLGVDEERRRISLSIKQLSTVPEYTGTAEPTEPAKPKKRKKPLRGGLEGPGDQGIGLGTLRASG